MLTPPDNVAVFLSPGPQSVCQVNVSVQAQTGKVTSALQAVVPPDAVSVTHLTVAGAPAVSYWRYPSITKGASAQVDTLIHMVVVAQGNSAGGVNLYTLLSTTYARPGENQQALLADTTCGPSFSAMMGSLALPGGAHGSTRPAPQNLAGGSMAGAIQYANKAWNWKFNDGECCVSAGSAQEVPDFQCAEFVSRALSAEGLVPGLTPSSSWDSYGSYGHDASTNAPYNLRLVGDLYTYLTSNFGKDIGDNPAQASPGDVVFYYNFAGALQHVALLTVTGSVPGGSDTLMDAHNVAEQDDSYADVGDGVNPFPRTIVHLYVNNADDVYMAGTNGQLYDYHWSRTTGTNGVWNTTDLNTAVTPQLNVTFIGKPSGGTSVLDGSLLRDVSAVASDGNLYKFWQQSGTWHVGQLAPPSGVRFTGSPTGIDYELPGQITDRYAIFVEGNNGDLYVDTYTEGGSWVLSDLTAALGPSCVKPSCTPAFRFTGTPSVISFVQMESGNPKLVVDVYDVGNDGELYQYWWDQGVGSWQENNLDSYATPSDGAGFVGSPSAITYERPGSSPVVYHNVYVEGSDGHVYQYYWCSQCSWQLMDLTTSVGGPSGVSFTGTPSASSVVMSGSLIIDVFVTGSDHQLYSYWWEGNWNWQDISSAANATSTQVVSSPSGFSYYLYGNSLDRCSVWVLTGNGHLQQFLAVQNSPWILYDQGAPPATLTGDPDANGYVSF